MQQFSEFFTQRFLWLNMFRASYHPFIRSIQLHPQSLVLHTLQVEGFSVVGRGLTGYELVFISCQATTNNITSFNLQSMQNQRLWVQLYAPDNEWYKARNMLSHKQTLSKKLRKLFHFVGWAYNKFYEDAGTHEHQVNCIVVIWYTCTWKVASIWSVPRRSMMIFMAYPLVCWHAAYTYI